MFVGALVLANGALRASNSLHHEILHNTMRSPMLFFDTTPIGRILNRFSKDLDMIDNMIPRNIQSWAFCTLMVLSTLVVLSYCTPIFMAVAVPLAILYWLIQVEFQWRISVAV